MQEFPRYREVAAEEGVPSRAQFLTKVYVHLLGAILLFVGIEAVLFTSGLAYTIAAKIASFGQAGWLGVLGGFMLVGWLASRAAHTLQSLPGQYLALGGYVLAQAIIFVLPLAIANSYYPGAIGFAALVTIGTFTALSAVVLLTRSDFSFLRSILFWGGIIALAAIVGGIFFGFNLGLGFIILMIAFAGGAVLYDTSNVLHHYPEDRFVGASLELFSSIALLFWYILQLFMRKD